MFKFLKRKKRLIDFRNGIFIKLKNTETFKNKELLEPLFIPGEEFIGEYQGIRDFVVFTTHRVIAVNIHGASGSKKNFTSVPYSKISTFSVQTASLFDIDSELEMYIIGVGKIRFDFTGRSDIVRIGQIISQYALK